MEKNNKFYTFKNLEGYTLRTVSNRVDLRLKKDNSISDFLEFSKKINTETPLNNGEKGFHELYDFFKLYESIFDDNDEREPSKDIVERIFDDNDNHTLLNICQDKNKKVVGGFILEYYVRSQCCILTYLFVSDEIRSKGLGKALIKEGLRWVIQSNLKTIDDKQLEVKAIFLETETPLYTFFLENDKKKAKEKEAGIHKRLSFFAKKVNAKWTDIPYVQPRLPMEEDAPKKNKAYHLLLLILPNITKQTNPFLLEKTILLRFITEFYYTVEQSYRTDKQNLDYENCLNLIDKYCKKIEESKGNLNFNHWEDFEVIFKESVSLDLNLARILLSIEILDAIDDLDPGNTLSITKNTFANSLTDELNTKIVVANELRTLQLRIKEQINDIADKIRDKKNEANTQNWDKNELAEKINELVAHDQSSTTTSLLPIFDTFKRIYIEKGFSDINDDFYLREIPKFKSPNLHFNKAAISIHLIKDKDLANNEPNFIQKVKNFFSSSDKNEVIYLQKEDKENIYCPYFHSFEKDLFALRYHNNSPYVSKIHSKCEIEIEFPYEVQFLSEGRQETLFINAEREFDFLTLPANNKSDDATKTSIHYDKYVKKLQCSLSFIYFKDTNIRIWELVFNNFIENDNTKIPLNEFEIIQLSKFFSGKQERNLPSLTITHNGKPEERISEIIEYLQSICTTHNSQSNKPDINYSILCGTIQIDTQSVNIFDENESDYTNLFEDEEKIKDDRSKISLINKINYLQESYLRDNINDEQLIRDLYGLEERENDEKIYYSDLYSNIRLSHQGQEQKDFERNYNENKYLNTILNFMCGVSLGIFDYERMGYPEVLDTLKPLEESATDDYMILVNRNSLVCFCHEDSVFDTALYTIGISPYLIIPNSVLAYNHYIAEERVNALMDYALKGTFEKNEKKAISGLLGTKYAKEKYSLIVQIRSGIERWRGKIVNNVFQYPTEKEIYTYGMEHRTTNQYLTSSKEQESYLSSQIEEYRESRRSNFEFFLEAFLGFIGVFQIKSVVRELIDITVLNDYMDKLRVLIFNCTSDTDTLKMQKEAVELLITFIIYWTLIYLFFKGKQRWIKRNI